MKLPFSKSLGLLLVILCFGMLAPVSDYDKYSFFLEEAPDYKVYDTQGSDDLDELVNVPDVFTFVVSSYCHHKISCYSYTHAQLLLEARAPPQA